MRHKLFTITLLVGLIFCLPAQAIILDEEPPKPVAKPKPKPQGKSRMELENERMKKELQALKRKQQQEENDEDTSQEAVQTQKETEQTAIKIDMVQLPTGIQMGKYEVTQGQWRAVMGNNPSNFTSCGDTCPVEQVSWDEVQAFILRLNSQTGKHYRLPSEDEWYSACQAGSYSSEHCGSNSIDAMAWYSSNSGKTTHAVGQKQPNAWGLYDMSGNVWEWTSSCHENDCSGRAFLGGSWYIPPSNVRSADRYGGDTSYRYFTLGFRLAQDR